MKQGKTAEAEIGYRELVQKYADHVEIDTWRVRLGLSLYTQKKHKEAVASLQPIVAQLKAADQKAEAFFLIGASHFQLRNFKEAAAALSDSQENIRRYSAKALSNLGGRAAKAPK